MAQIVWTLRHYNNNRQRNAIKLAYNKSGCWRARAFLQKRKQSWMKTRVSACARARAFAIDWMWEGAKQRHRHKVNGNAKIALTMFNEMKKTNSRYRLIFAAISLMLAILQLSGSFCILFFLFVVRATRDFAFASLLSLRGPETSFFFRTYALQQLTQFELIGRFVFIWMIPCFSFV